MSAEEYIASGILEAFVMDQLDEKERAEVLQMAEKHPEIKAEIAAIEEGLMAFAQKGAIAPPSSIKEKIFADIQPAQQETPKEEETPVRSLPQGGKFYQYFAIAASILAVIGLSLAAYFYQQYRSVNTQLAEALSDQQQMAQQFNLTRQKNDAMEQQLAFLSKPGVKMVRMHGLNPAPDALATVFWDENSDNVMLKVNQMPDNPEAKQYQLWAIVDGKPVDAGVFDVHDQSGGMLKMKNIKNAQAFAVTLEPKGGSKTPTMDQMYVMGKVQSPPTS